MTDEQVQQVVEALGTEWWEPWLSSVVALAAVVVGWWLGSMTERRARASREKAEAEADLAAVVRRAAVMVGQLATAVGSLRAEQLRAVQFAAPEVGHDLNRFDGTGAVGGWWLRQVVKLILLEAPRSTPPGVTADRRLTDATLLMASVDARLQGWARGEVAAQDFAPEFDADWDTAIRTHHATRRDKI